MKFSLRPYQMQGIHDIRSAYRQGYRSPVYVAPTGSGKTVLFVHIAERMIAEGKRCYIVVHRKELRDQAAKKLTEFGVRFGIIASGVPQLNNCIMVASVGTLINRLEKTPEPDLVIFDEGHHVVKGNQWGKICQKWQRTRYLGVTATPCRTNGDGLGVGSHGYYDTIVHGPSVKSLTPEYLSPYKIFTPDAGIRTDGVNITAGDYNKRDLNIAVDKPTITGCAVEHYKNLCPDVPAIAFCCSIAHAEHVSQMFNQSGIPSAPVDGKLDGRLRAHRMGALETGEIKVLTSCDLISEGFDVPILGAAILLRPTWSLTLYMQQVGRALRVSPGKSHATILDHAGNCFRHGFPDDEREWTLEGNKKRRKRTSETAIQIRQCPKCYYTHKTGVQCPSCGFIYETKQREIEEVKGKLKELTPEQKQKISEQHKRRATVAGATTLNDLRMLAEKMGYKSGWADHVWRSRQAKKTNKQLEMVFNK